MKSENGVLTKIFGKKQPSGDAIEKALAAILTIENRLASAGGDLAAARGAFDAATAADLGGTGKPGNRDKLAAALTEKRQEVDTLARLLAAAKQEAQGVMVAERAGVEERISGTEGELLEALRRVDWRRAKKIAELVHHEAFSVTWPTNHAAGSIGLPVFALSPEEITAVANEAAETPRAVDPDADKLADLRAHLNDLNVIRAMPAEMGLDVLLSRRRRGQ